MILNFPDFLQAEVLLPSAAAILLTILLVACLLCRLSKKKKEAKVEENLEVDDNPVYQQYQLVGEDYERQYSVHEVVDRNDYYE